MKKNHLLAMMTENFTTIAVQYATPDGIGRSVKTYTYKTDNMTLQPGDFVTVPGSNGRFPSVCQVVEVHETPQIDTDSDIEYKWIYGKIDTTAYDKRTAMEKEAVNILNQAERAAARDRALRVLQEEVGTEAVQRVKSFFNPTIAIDAPAKLD